MEESLATESIALAFNSGIVLAIVQLLKVVVLPKMRASYPWAIPLVASVVGLASSVVLAWTGIDITPIAGAFTGFAASGIFAFVKEAVG